MKRGPLKRNGGVVRVIVLAAGVSLASYMGVVAQVRALAGLGA